MSRPVLIVGASGPLGGAVLRELETHSHEVIGVSRSGRRRLDFRDTDAARAALESARPKAVIHLARPDEERSDEAALAEFASLCAEYAVERFVFASSSAVYGTEASEPRREDDDAESPTQYAQLKRRSESTLAAVATATGIPVISLRIFNAYGPGFGDSLVNRLALSGTPNVYMSDNFVRDYIHSSDIARAFRLAVEIDNAGYQVLNVGTGVGTSNPELLALFPAAAYRPLAGDAVRSFSVADASRIAQLWGFAPTIALADVILYPELVS